MSPMTQDTAVRLQRTIPADPARVFRAWLDPEMLVQWMAPRGHGVTRAEVDPRPGGRYRIWQEGPDGEPAGGFECELLELVPDERLVARWAFVGPDRLEGPGFDSLLTVTLRPAPGGATELTLVHERLEAFMAAMPEPSGQVQAGWEGALDKLTTALGGGD